MKHLPKWLQCNRSKDIQSLSWEKDLQPFDMFIGVLQGSDGEINHAIGIFNNWIFDGNEKVAIPLCKEGLDYCCSTSEIKNEFVKFYDGFFFRDMSEKKQRAKKHYNTFTSNPRLAKKARLF